MDDIAATDTGPPPGREPRPRRALAATLAVAVVLIAAGTYAAADSLLGRVSTTDETIERPVRSLHLMLVHGDARISGYDGDTIRIRRTLTRSVLEPVERREFRGDALKITTVCHYTAGDCRVDYDIKVPRRTMIDASLAFGHADFRGLSGDVDLTVLIGSAALSGLDGPVTVKTLHQELQATDISGPVFKADSSGGDIFLKQVDSPKVDVHSNGGDITMRGTGENESVSAITDNGDITVLLPEKAEAHDVHASAPTEPVIEIPQAQDGPPIFARSETGTVIIRQEER